MTSSVAPQARLFLDRWHEIVAARDLGGLPAVLAESVELGAPPYWDALRGRHLVAHLLGVILETIEGFTYHRQWLSGNELALEFRGRVGKLELQGIDLISLDDAGRIARLDVLIRPMNALAALRDAVAPKMMEYLSRDDSA
jgi:hypothetical protein